MINSGPVLIISSDDENRAMLVASVLKSGMDPHSCANYGEARGLLEKESFGVILCSDSLVDGDYFSVIERAKPIPVVVTSRLAQWNPYLAALRAGAFDYIACPPNPSEVERILWSALDEYSRVHREARSLA